MNFLRLSDYFISPLFEDEDIVAIDKPYGFNCHTNESLVGNENHVEHGLIEIFERQLARKLHIVHRLDQTTTGVVIFAKSQESAKKYADFFFHRQVKKSYLFITASRSSSPTFEIDQNIIHKAKDLPAKTSFRFLKKTPGFELWQAHPLTGRNHQIRIHANAGGLPLLGDERYGGQRFPFLCLHNRKIEFPNGIVIESRPPAYFEDLEILDHPHLAKVLHENDRRIRLFKSDQHHDQCFRLFHRPSDANESDITIDQFGSILVMSRSDNDWHESDKREFADFATRAGKPLVVRFLNSETSGREPIILSPKPLEQTWTASESKAKYELQLNSGATVGLLLDQRLQRKWLSENVAGKSVLNLFSSTCGFGVVAALGGAKQVTSIDTSKSALSRGRRNFELNELPAENASFLCRDSLVYLDVCQKKNIKFDIVVCHAPAFFRGEKKTFNIINDLESLLKSCLSCLHENGELLFLTHAQNLFIYDIRRSIEKVQREMGLSRLEVNCILPALDFELIGEKPRLKSFLLKLSP